MRPTLRPFVTLLGALALAGAGPFAVAACKKGDDEAVLLDKAFKQEITSADVSLSLAADVRTGGRTERLRFLLNGPYRDNGDLKLPSFDWKVRASGAGETLRARVTSTGDNLFVRYTGRTYEVGEEAVSTFNRELAQSGELRVQDLAGLGIDMRRWIPKAKTHGAASIAGVETTHVAGRLDVSEALLGLNKLFQHPAIKRELAGEPPPVITRREIAEIDKLVTDPVFHVFVGKRDTKIRRLSAKLRFAVPAHGGRDAHGPERGTVSFAVELANVDGDQRVDAPQSGRPIRELLRELGIPPGGLEGVQGRERRQQ